MKMAKKAFSLVLALVMLVNVFAAMASAAAPDSAVDLYLSTDKTTYAPGDEIVITVSEQVIDVVGNMTIGGQFAVGYDSSAIQPYSTSNTIEDHGFEAIQDGYLAAASCVSLNANNVSMGDFIDESQASYGWDEIIMYVVGDDGTIVDATSKVDLFTIKMKVADDAVDGEYTLNFNAGSYMNYSAYVCDEINMGIYGYDDDYGYGTTANYGFNGVTIKVSSATAPELDVTAAKNQIRYMMNADGSFKEINVRTRATISCTELQTLLGVTANDDVELAIVEAGFVYGADIDAATAKTVAEGTAVDGYTKTTVSYIQNDGTNYIYTYMVDGLTADKIADSAFEAVGYITLTIDGTNYTFCYDAETAVSPLELYNGTYAKANLTYGWSLAAIS